MPMSPAPRANEGNSNKSNYLKHTIHVMSRCPFEPPVPYTIASVDTAEHRNWCRCSLEEHPRGIQEPTQEVQGLRVELGSGQLGNPSRFKSVRRDISRIKTVLGESSAGSSSAAAAP